MKKLLLASVLAIVSTSANAWTDRFGHWHEGPGFVAPYSPASPMYYSPYAYVPPPPVVYGYGGPVYVAPPTDAQVIAGTVLGIASIFARGRGW